MFTNGRRRRNAVCPGCGATDAYVSPFSGGLNCRACPGKPIPHVQIAANAIKAMYDTWQARGGVSPDATDELLAAAGALGLKLDHSVARSDPILVAAGDGGFDAANAGASLEEIAKIYVEAFKQSGRLKRPNGMRRNSDDELRELERAYRRTGAADDAVRLARALLRHGRDRVDATAFMRSCGVAPVEAHEMVAEATGVPLVEWKLINYGVNVDEENGWEINDLHYTGETIQLPADATHSEVRDALVDERIIRAGLEVDSEASSETNVVFRRPSDQRPVGALERAARGNPPLADRDDHRYRYVANCVHSTAEDISAMVESAREITRPYFVRKLAPGEWVEIQRTLGYGPSFPITRDRTISYYRSMFRGQPAVFLEWSAIEYVFTLDGKLGPSAGRDRDALDMRPRSGERGRRRSL